MQNFDATNHIDELDNILNFRPLRCLTKDEIDFSLKFEANHSEIIESGG